MTPQAQGVSLPVTSSLVKRQGKARTEPAQRAGSPQQGARVALAPRRAPKVLRAGPKPHAAEAADALEVSDVLSHEQRAGALGREKRALAQHGPGQEPPRLSCAVLDGVARETSLSSARERRTKQQR